MTDPGSYFAVHLQELRQRLVVVFAAVILASVAAYWKADDLVRMLVVPLSRVSPEYAHLVYTNLPEAFVSYLKVSVLVGVVAAFPVLVYEAWMFIAPGLHRHEKRFARWIVFWGGVLFLFGVGFSYLVAVPRLLVFLLAYAHPDLEPALKLGPYLTFVARSSLAFGIAFEMPFLMVMLSRTGLVTPGYFSRKRKFSYIGIVVVAFLLVAGDPVATVIVALPLCLLYEAGILIGRLLTPRNG